jgi:hypothetical protein
MLLLAEGNRLDYAGDLGPSAGVLSAMGAPPRPTRRTNAMKLRNIAGQMLFVVACAAGFASLREVDYLHFAIASNLLLVALVAASLRARFAADPFVRSWWFGFALFGWAHSFFMFTSVNMGLLTNLVASLLPHLFVTKGSPPMSYAVMCISVAQVYMTLVLAWLGGNFSGYLHRRTERGRQESGGDAHG